jgi:hypothetical protein
MEFEYLQERERGPKDRDEDAGVGRHRMMRVSLVVEEGSLR